MDITPTEARVPYPRRVFCNRNLRLDRIHHVGFDMDYTLALYEEAMEHLQAEMVLQRLIDRYGYAESVATVRYDPHFPIRGLTVDTQLGNVFKMDAYRFVSRVWHGAGPLEREVRRQLYTNRKISPGDPDLVMIDTLFSLPEISLYCQLVALLEAAETQHAEPLHAGAREVTYRQLWLDLREAMDELHRDGTLKARILADIPKYIRRDPELGETLHRLRSSGKKLFLLTNSEPHYTEAVMAYLLNGQQQAYPGWIDYFDLVLTSARKPTFFTGDAPFLVAGGDGAPATALRRGVLYTGGSYKGLAELAGLDGDDVMYVGDHIYGDILRSKRSTSWRTAMIVPEMERELQLVAQMAAEIQALERMEIVAFQLELERSALALDKVRDAELNAQLREVTAQAKDLQAAINDVFNPAWGQLFRDRSELSAFGTQVEDYACVYTSRVTNFRSYSPMFYFRSPRDRMAHEFGR